MKLLEALREPDHTGDRRCWPCTVVNVVLIAVGALLVGRRRRALGLLVVGVGTLLVWTRGYVVPYTPQFAPRLVAAAPIPDEWFGHADRRSAPTGSDGLAEDVDGEALLATLRQAGVLVVDGDAVDLAPSFREAWETEMGTLAAKSSDDLAEAVFEVSDAASVSVTTGPDRSWIRLGDGSGSVTAEAWLSRPVAVAETAAVRVLGDWLDDPTTRRAAAGPLRVFLTDCPDCGVPLVESTTTNCCGGTTPERNEPAAVLVCPDCDSRLHTFE